MTATALLADSSFAPQHVEPDIHWLLQNWGNWSRSRPQGGHCASAEFRYNSPQHWYPPGPRVDVDDHAALSVECCMRDVPKQHAQALRLHYIERVPAKFACKKLALPYAIWERFLNDARCMLANRLSCNRI